MRFRFIVSVIGALLALLHAAPALAHGDPRAITETVTQVIAGRTFTMTIAKPAEVPALLSIDLASLENVAATAIKIRAVLPESADAAGSSVVARVVEYQPGRFHADALIEQRGTWLLELQVSDQDGAGTATIPVTIGPAPPSTTTLVLLILTMLVAIVMLVGLIVFAVRHRKELAQGETVRQVDAVRRSELP
jgi:hypothetical protein